ncbi:TetR/AcrR family transcriptional regulator [Streptomyces alanosinicus]|uniref:TetR family transcriptional regulator n=1 Tax=Streptomyces alanosinicus TaxID=68171 RepID=A0A918YJ19_9ACTN|nr:TetR/AcrR family transcriptional regulator [Streptomyces alanosinicus]GHE03933.1 TetR family transcriptional regulator [Streptomyces alanosinicus]
MSERRPRKDALRNRAAVFTAADALFADCQSPDSVTMADIAVAAGVGKATLFRAFGDRTGLIRALYAARLEPVRTAVEQGPPPLGPDAEPLVRVPALLDAVLCLKLDNRHLALALEQTGSDSPYGAEYYAWCHTLLRTLLERIPGLPESDFTAHALLAATRADLVEHLAGEQGLPRDEMRARLAGFTARILGAEGTQGHQDTQESS